MEDITTSPGLSKLFDDVAQPTQVREQPKETTTAPPENVPTEKPNVPIDKKMVEATSEIVISLIDTVQTNGFRIWANVKRNNIADALTDSTAGYAKLMRAVSAYKTNDKNGGEIEMLNATDVQLLELHDKVFSFIEDLPFTKKETENLMLPLSYIIEKNGGSLPPELALVIGLVTAVGSRIGEMYTF